MTIDGERGRCWRSGETWGGKSASATPRPITPKPPKKPPQVYAELREAVTAARLNIKGATVGGEHHYPDDALVIVRFDLPDGSKRCRPFHPAAGGWAQGDPQGPLPLYGTDKAVAGSVPIIVEGEKCADAGHSVGLYCVTSSHGAQSADKTDWSKLKPFGEIVIVPDRDEPGEKYLNAVAAMLKLQNPRVRIRVLRLDGIQETPPGFDLADWLDEHDGAEADDLKAQVEDMAAAAPVHVPTDLSGEEIVTFSGLPIGTLIDLCPDMRPFIIDGLLRQGETMNVISAPKIGKSWLSLMIALCVVTGRAIFGIYPVKRGKVLLLDNELHKETLARRVHTLAKEMGIQRHEYEDKLIVESFRGRLRDWYKLRTYFASITPGEFALVLCDAFYRFMPAGADENDNGTMSTVFNAIDSYAEMIQAAFILIHHSSKGLQNAKAVTDVGAGAGAQSRATDTHLILRHHEENDVVVLDAAVRSWKPIEPMCIRWKYPMWTPALELDATQLRRENRPRKEKSATTTDAPIEEVRKPDPWTLDRFIGAFITESPQDKASIMLDAKFVGVGMRDAEQLFRSGVSKGRIFEWRYAGDARRKAYAKAQQPVLATADPEGSK